MLFDTLPTAFPWYDRIGKMNRNKFHTDEVCDYKLNSPYNALLPFEFRRVAALSPPMTWQILDVNTNVLVADITTSISLVRARTRDGYDYFYYAGEALSTALGALNLEVARYYVSKIQMSDGQNFYSEMFYVPVDKFSAAFTEETSFIRIEWYNDADLNPIFYNDINGTTLKPYFRNVVYLDSFIHASEPEIAEETTTDGNDTPIPTFQRAAIRYQIADLVPDFLKVALVLAQMHDHVWITTPLQLYSGEIENIETTSTQEAFGALSSVTIIFEESIAIVKKACAGNMPSEEPLPLDPFLLEVKVVGSNLVVTGANLPPVGYWSFLYNSTTGGGTYTKINYPMNNVNVEAGTQLVPTSVVPTGNYFKLQVVNFNDYSLFSNVVLKS